ncbi:MAG: UDP-N-acetylmuramoyl-tripeptide--D-alanyl-D-alanine ligase [Clostridia bacterium]|nr:UDP-N-acetylmuramoyl-tripeptide--D-alanyl-D-alanine ligase [Clostridia bacterium]
MNQMFSLEEIISAVNGKLIIGSDCKMNEPVFVSGVSKDTRTIEPGQMYVALVGENFDGHSFCNMALEKGASLLLVSDISYLPTKCLAVLVDDTRVALGLLARHYRFKIGAKVIAVTGSVGKTSTREMIAAGLDKSFKVYSTKANLNNDIGLPMTILSAPIDTEVLVLEMGMRLRGEISYLTSIACPDIAVITNIGFSHIERLGSQKEILLAKFEITEGLVAGGVLALNGDDKFLADYALENITIANLVASSNITKDVSPNNYGICVKAENIAISPSKTSFDIDIKTSKTTQIIKDVIVNAPGVHHVRNATFAFICAAALNADFEKVKEGIASYEPMAGRGAVLEGDKITVIDDAYNAAPESMELSFSNLDIIGKGRKIAVLGGMLELGDYAPMLHEKVGKSAGSYNFDKIFLMGDNKDDFVSGLLSEDKDSCYEVFDNISDLEKSLREYITDGDTILFKASNAFGFQKLARTISEELN